MTGPISIPPEPPTPWLTRAYHIIAFILIGIVFVATSPLWIIAALIANAFTRRKFILLRVLCYLCYYFVLGTICLAGIAFINLRRIGDFDGLRYDYTRFRLWWGERLLRAGMFFLSMRIETFGEEVIAPGPLLVFINHSSMVDPMIPMYFVSKRHGVDLRWIIKKELLIDPNFDIVGLKLGDCFVERQSGNPDEQIRRVAKRGENLDTMGVLLYPEGTRYTAEKHARALKRLENKPELLAIAQGFRHVLPPRVGGPLALIETAPDVDILFCAHVGLEGMASIVDLLRGEIIGTSVKVFFWRVSARDIPHTNTDRWLFEQWARVDQLIHDNKTSAHTQHDEKIVN